MKNDIFLTIALILIAIAGWVNVFQSDDIKVLKQRVDVLEQQIYVLEQQIEVLNK